MSGRISSPPCCRATSLRTLVLLAGVGLITFVVGTGTAWLVTMCRFPLRPLFVWASLLPMAMPGYIVAYAYVDLLSYAGPGADGAARADGLEEQGRLLVSRRSARSAAPSLVLSMVLYPYVFLTARASFIRQPATQLEVARALGRTPWGAFRDVALPLARPGIAVGVSLVLMECLNDIGAAGFFGVKTLTLGIYTTWLSQGNLGGAAQISAVMLLFIFAAPVDGAAGTAAAVLHAARPAPAPAGPHPPHRLGPRACCHRLRASRPRRLRGAGAAAAELRRARGWEDALSAAYLTRRASFAAARDTRRSGGGAAGAGAGLCQPRTSRRTDRCA